MKADEERKIRAEIGSCLHEMGIYPKLIGFTNLINTVITVVDRGVVNVSICEAYKEAGRKINRSAASVERSIRILIAKCESVHGFDKLNEYFGHQVYRNFPLSSGELVSLFATKISFDHRINE